MRENGRSERPKNGADAQPCLSDVYKNGTRAKRRQADVPLCGRSMVEMLGVLAIIGVLSVGAMSGYAKAMLKYKLNKLTESLSMLFVNYVELDTKDYTNNMIAHIAPDSFMLYNSNLVAADVFGNYWSIGEYGLYVRIGYSGSIAEGAYVRDESAIRDSCPVILQAGKDAGFARMVLFTPDSSTTICNQDCRLSYIDLNISKIRELCETVANAANGDAILYFQLSKRDKNTV